MPARTNEFQRLIAIIQSHLDPGSTVTESAMFRDTVTGTDREVDIVVSGQVGRQKVTVSIECRDRSRPADVTWVEQAHAMHSRLPTNVLVLVSHKGFTSGARKLAENYGIRCLDFADVDSDAPQRLFPNMKSVWGKAWSITVERVEVFVEQTGELPAEKFVARGDNHIVSEDGRHLTNIAGMAEDVVRSRHVIEKLTADGKPDHTYLEMVLERPTRDGGRACVHKMEPNVIRSIKKVRMVARCEITVNEFPLRHGLFDEVRVAYGSGFLLGKPAMVVATSDGQDTRVTLHTSEEDPL